MWLRQARTLLAWACALLCAAAVARGDAAGASASSIQAELDAFDAAVRHADQDSGAAHGKKDVVDLGASLRIVEDRFSGLRAALLAEMGGHDAARGGAAHNPAADRLHGHAKDLSTQGADMIQKLAQSRAEVHSVLSEVRVVDDATVELRKAITSLEKEIADLGNALRQAQVDSSVLSSAHNDLRNSVKDVHEESHTFQEVGDDIASAGVPKWYFFVLFEFVALLAFAAFKVFKMKRRDKFSKLG